MNNNARRQSLSAVPAWRGKMRDLHRYITLFYHITDVFLQGHHRMDHLPYPLDGNQLLALRLGLHQQL